MPVAVTVQNPVVVTVETDEGTEVSVSTPSNVVQVNVNGSIPIPIGVSGGGASADDFVFGETPNGVINGINATYTTDFDFVPETVEVKLNGLTQKVVDDYNTSGTDTIIFLVSPLTDDKILVNYIKQ